MPGSEPNRDAYKHVEARLLESEQRFRQLAESINEAFWLTEWSDRKVIYVSPAYESMWGVSCESLYDNPRSWADNIHPDDRARVVESFDRHAELGSYVEEYRILQPDGGLRWIYDRAFPIRDESGRVYRMAGISEDITGRKLAELVHQSRAKVLERLAAGAPLDEVLTLLVRTTEEVRPQMICSILMLDHAGGRLHHGSAPSLPDFYKQAIDGLRIGPNVGSCGSAAYHGKRIVVEDVMTDRRWTGYRELMDRVGLRACWSEPVISAGGEVLGTFAMYYHEPRKPDEFDLHLISTAAHLAGIAIERKRQEAASTALQEQLIQAHKMEAVGQLASGVAHDFNNLLQVISGSVELARYKVANDPAVGDLLKIVQDAVEQGTGVTHALLSLSRSNPTEKKSCDLRAVVSAAASLVTRLLPASVQLRTAGTDGQPMWVLGDRSQLQQVILNLAVNARDAMPDGGVLRIAISQSGATPNSSAGEQPCSCVLEIADSGTGIPRDKQWRVFEPFFTTKARERGTGLGLAIVHRIVMDHGGDIGFESGDGVGTTFRISLPLAVSQSGHAPDCAEDSPPDGRGRLILLAEDHELVRKMLTRHIESLGFRVLASKEGDAAMDSVRASRHQADLVLLDVEMPKRSGLQCLQAMRDEGIETPVILLTGNASVEGAEHLLGDTTRILYKPFHPTDLNLMISEMTAHAAPTAG